jgi:outer membrane protein assembly factor BamE
MRIYFIITTLLILVTLNGCNLLQENTQLRSFRVLVEQGNLIEENKVDSLKINMTKDQVVFLLGEPIVNNIFNKERWDYVYYRKREPEETQLKMISIFFKNNSIINMKKISKNNDGLFEINEDSKEKPEFTDENKTETITEKMFDEIELKETKIKDEELPENNKELEFDKNEKNNNIEDKRAYKEKITKTDTNKSIKVNEKNDQDIIIGILDRWEKSWEDKNIDKYFSFYLNGYSSLYYNDHEMWKADRDKRIKNKSKIEINIVNLKINIESSVRANVIFTQNYSSEKYADTVIKQIKFEKINNKWKIIFEELVTN